MMTTTTAPPPPDVDPIEQFDRLPALSRVEVDRYCEGCGYNLHTQAVRRDPRTALLLVRCPECGRFHPAPAATQTAQLWLRRGATLLLLIWSLLVISGVVTVAFIEGGITVATIEELDRRYDYRTGQRTVPLYMRQQDPKYRTILYIMGAASLATGFVGVAAATVVFPHWRRAWYSLFALGLPVGVALVIFGILWLDSPRPTRLDHRWMYPYIWAHVFVQFLGGILGAMAGRPLTRLLVRILLPERLRAPLAFLWSADGLQPPRAGTPSEPGGAVN